MSNAKTYSFKAVGETISENAQTKRIDIKTVFPVGIKTPAQFDYDRGDFLAMHYSTANQIKDNFKNMLLTNNGERPCQYDFGANLQELVMEMGDESVDQEAMRRIMKTTNKYMPYITLNDFETFTLPRDTGGPAINGIRITYSVPAARINQQAIEVILYMGG